MLYLDLVNPANSLSSIKFAGLKCGRQAFVKCA